MARRRILLVPSITELEWLVKPLLEEWADVASYDPPWLSEGLPGRGLLFDAVAERGLAELDRRGWATCVVAADEFGIASALRLAAARPKAVTALALGHACLSFRRTGDRAPLNPDVFGAFVQLLRVDYRSFVHQILQNWDPRRGSEAACFGPDELATRWLERVPQGRMQSIAGRLEHELDALGDLGAALARMDAPLLFAQHEGCVAFTAEGFEDAVAAFPDACVVRVPVGPPMSSEFARELRRFCLAAVAPRARANHARD